MLNKDGEEIEGVMLRCIVCGKDFEVLPYAAKKRKMCGDKKCLDEYIRRKVADYRKTEIGKQRYTEYNKRYKRDRVVKVCSVCGNEFVTTYSRRVRCDECKIG